MVDTVVVNGILLAADNTPLRQRRVTATPRPQNFILVSGEAVSLISEDFTDVDGFFSLIIIKAAGTIYSIQTRPERRLPDGIELRSDDWSIGAVIDLDDLPRAISPGQIPGQTVEELMVTLQNYINANTQIGVPFSDTRAALTVGAGSMGYPNGSGRSLTIVGVGVHAGIAPTGASLILNVRKNGVSIFTDPSHRPAILAGTVTAVTSLIDIAGFAPGDVLTVDIDQVGSVVPGGHLTVNVVVQG